MLPRTSSLSLVVTLGAEAAGESMRGMIAQIGQKHLIRQDHLHPATSHLNRLILDDLSADLPVLASNFLLTMEEVTGHLYNCGCAV